MSLYTQPSKMVNKYHNIILSVLSLSSLPRYPSFCLPSFLYLSLSSLLSSFFPPFSFLLRHWHHSHLLPLSLGFLGQQTTVCPSGPCLRLQDDTHPGKSNLQIWQLTLYIPEQPVFRSGPSLTPGRWTLNCWNIHLIQRFLHTEFLGHTVLV